MPDLLVGLIQQQDTIAARVLASIDLRVERRDRLSTPTTVSPSFNEPVSKVCELALREALSLGQNYIGTEHILLGIVRLDSRTGTKYLAGKDGEVREATMALLLGSASDPEEPEEPECDPGVGRDFLEALAEEANIVEWDGQTWMALQRLLDRGWRIEAP
jgi:ATP-dependent Clp protease ATP-binding subunit ClpA